MAFQGFVPGSSSPEAGMFRPSCLALQRLMRDAHFFLGEGIFPLPYGGIEGSSLESPRFFPGSSEILPRFLQDSREVSLV